MRADGASAPQLAAFARRLDGLARPGAGLLPGDALEPLGDVDALDDLPGPPDGGLDRVAIVKLNGGLGTSMGLSAPKSTIEAKDGRSFLDVIARQVLALRERTGARLPLVLMDSPHTRAPTLQALERHRGLGGQDVPRDFLQGREPKLRADDHEPVQWPPDRELEWCPPGHGELYVALAGSGMLDALLDAGYDLAFTSNADNLGAVADPRIAAWMTARRIPFAMEVVQGTQADRKGGHLARARRAHRAARDRSGPRRRRLVRRCRALALVQHEQPVDRPAGVARAPAARPRGPELPLIVNHKTVDPTDPDSPPVLQLENAMGAAIGAIDGARPLHVARDRFVPVKTTDDLLVLRSDAYALGDDGRLRPQFDGDPPVVSLDARYKLLADFDARFADGLPSLRWRRPPRRFDERRRLRARTRQPDRRAHRLQRRPGPALRDRRRGHGHRDAPRRRPGRGRAARSRRRRWLRRRRPDGATGWRAFVRGAVGRAQRRRPDASRPPRWRSPARSPRARACRRRPRWRSRWRWRCSGSPRDRAAPRRWSWPSCAPRVENDWVGAQTGLLDQIASLIGGRSTRALRIDFATLAVGPVPLRTGDWTLVTRRLPRAARARRRRLQRAPRGVRRARASCWVCSWLAHADRAAASAPPDPLDRRAPHVLDENARVRGGGRRAARRRPGGGRAPAGRLPRVAARLLRRVDRQGRGDGGGAARGRSRGRADGGGGFGGHVLGPAAPRGRRPGRARPCAAVSWRRPAPQSSSASASTIWRPSGRTSAQPIMNSAKAIMPSPAHRSMRTPGRLGDLGAGVEDPQDGQHDPVEQEQPADDAAQVEQVAPPAISRPLVGGRSRRRPGSADQKNDHREHWPPARSTRSRAAAATPTSARRRPMIAPLMSPTVPHTRPCICSIGLGLVNNVTPTETIASTHERDARAPERLVEIGAEVEDADLVERRRPRSAADRARDQAPEAGPGESSASSSIPMMNVANSGALKIENNAWM